jgi:metal-responsive CopG/Arc/MetJ family transcriptional regulator
VKTAISIPDDVFRRADRLAKQRKISRSQLYTAALVKLLETDLTEGITTAYDSAFSDSEHDAVGHEAVRRVLEAVEWDDE